MVTRVEALAQITAAGEPFEIIEAEMFGRKVRVFKNAPVNLEQLFRESRSEKTFLVYDNERLTFEDTWRRACELAHALKTELGVSKGDRVAISMRNYPEWVISYMAATSIGAVAVAMNALWQPHEMDICLTKSGSVVLIADAERLQRLATFKRPENLKVIAVRTEQPDLKIGTIDFNELLARHPATEMPTVDVHPNDIATIYYTSGSTGNPKGVISSHRNIISALLSWEVDLHAAYRTGLLPPPPENPPQGAALLGIPLFHVTGSHAVYLACYRYQRKLVMMYKWDAATAAELIDREGVTAFTGPAAVTGDLVAYAKSTGRTFDTLTSTGGGGAPRAPEQVRAIAKVYANARPGTGWGMTETNAIGTGIGAQDYLDHPESSGRVSVVLDIRIVDENGAPLPANHRGELQVRGASIMQGYWQRPDANAETFVDGDWMRTGDVAYIDDDGFMYIVDRIKDLVIRGGENIGCGGVEAALVEHPSIEEACVFGIPDERLGEEVAAVVRLTAPVDETELRDFLSTRLAKFEIPRYMSFVTEPLPRGATGKVAKRELRAEEIKRMKLNVTASAS